MDAALSNPIGPLLLQLIGDASLLKRISLALQPRARTLTSKSIVEFVANALLVITGHRTAWLIDAISTDQPRLCEALTLLRHRHTSETRNEALRDQCVVIDVLGQLFLVNRAAVTRRICIEDVYPIFVSSALRNLRLPTGRELDGWRARLKTVVASLANDLSGATDVKGAAVEAAVLDPSKLVICPVALCGVLLGYPCVYDVCGPYDDSAASAMDAASGPMVPGDNCLGGAPLSVCKLSATIQTEGISGATVSIGFSVPIYILQATSGNDLDHMRHTIKAGIDRWESDMQSLAAAISASTDDSGWRIAADCVRSGVTLDKVAL